MLAYYQIKVNSFSILSVKEKEDSIAIRKMNFHQFSIFYVVWIQLQQLNIGSTVWFIQNYQIIFVENILFVFHYNKVVAQNCLLFALYQIHFIYVLVCYMIVYIEIVILIDLWLTAIIELIIHSLEKWILFWEEWIFLDSHNCFWIIFF